MMLGHRIITNINRYRHSHGYGVQSPFAYRFVSEVLHPKHRPNADKYLRKLLSNVDKKLCKRYKLYLRINEYWQTTAWIELDTPTEPHKRHTDIAQNFIKTIDKSEYIDGKFSFDKRTIIHLSTVDDYLNVIDRVNENVLMIVENINKDKASKQFWPDILADDRAGVTFDLRTFGIVFFDKKMHKQNYTLTF